MTTMAVGEIVRRGHRIDAPRNVQSGLTLIELLAAMVVMGIVSTLILMTWFTLQDSYSATTEQNRQREAARDAMTRIVRELRDAAPYSPAGSAVTYPAIRFAQGDEVRFYTTFNEAGNSDPSMLPTYTRFILRSGTTASQGLCLYLEKDDHSGGVSGAFTPDQSRLLLTNLANETGVTDLFSYTVVTSSAGTVITSTTSTPVMTGSITTVQITLRVDLNPGKTPESYLLHGTVQPRNLRHT